MAVSFVEFSASIPYIVKIRNTICYMVLAQNRSLGGGGANKQAREILKRKKEAPEGLLSIVSGKVVVSKLSEWSQKKFGVAFSPSAVVRSMRKSEVHPEVSSVIEAIENGKALR